MFIVSPNFQFWTSIMWLQSNFFTVQEGNGLFLLEVNSCQMEGIWRQLILSPCTAVVTETQLHPTAFDGHLEELLDIGEYSQAPVLVVHLDNTIFWEDRFTNISWSAKQLCKAFLVTKYYRKVLETSANFGVIIPVPLLEILQEYEFGHMAFLLQVKWL